MDKDNKKNKSQIKKLLIYNVLYWRRAKIKSTKDE